MKNLFYTIALFFAVLTSCESPMADIYDAIDNPVDTAGNLLPNKIVGQTSYTLTEEDYTDELDFNYPNFSSTDQAKELIPGFLTSKFPVWGMGSLAEITYDIYNRIPSVDATPFDVDASEYEPITGNSYGNFSSTNHVTEYAALKYPDAQDGDFYAFNCKYYAGSVSDRIYGVLMHNGAWVAVQGFDADAYTAMGESFPNLSSTDEAEEKLPIFLKDYNKYNTVKVGEPLMYVYETRFDAHLIAFVYDGINYTLYENILSETLQFGHDGSTWVPDNTVKYILTAADFALVGNDRYGNFDVRPGKDEEPISVRIEKINTILTNNFPDLAVEGQKFVVDYNVYNGSAAVYTIALIHDGTSFVQQ